MMTTNKPGLTTVVMDNDNEETNLPGLMTVLMDNDNEDLE